MERQEAREAALRASERAETVKRIAVDLAETFPTPADPGPRWDDPFPEQVFAHHLHSHGAPDPTPDEIRDGWRQVIDRWFERICDAVAKKISEWGIGSMVPEAWRRLLKDERANRLLDGSDPLARIIERPAAQRVPSPTPMVGPPSQQNTPTVQPEPEPLKPRAPSSKPGRTSGPKF